MRAHLLLLMVTALVAGCGEPEEDVIFIPDPLVSVIDFTGAKKKIPSGELYDSSTGQPTVDSVLVIDRATNRQVYVKMDQLSAGAQADAHHILVTEAPPVVPQAADHHR